MTAATAAIPATPPALAQWHDRNRLSGWLLTLAVGTIGGLLRWWNVSHPRGMVFDEKYYAIEAQEMLRFGYEDNRGYMFVVHPPLGKWFIGATSALAGNDEYGWRLASVIAGTVAVVVTTRVAQRMFRSNFFGALAGLFLALDGLSLVLSRIALLDIFLQPLLIGAFAALVCDRDQLRGRLAHLITRGIDLSNGVPRLGPRPWRLTAGVLLGLACAVKWSALSFLVAMVLLSLCWDFGALRAAGVNKPLRHLLRRSAPGAGSSFILASLGAYLLTWTGWFAGNNGYDRHWADTHSASSTLRLFGLKVPMNWGFLPDAIRSLGAYHLQAYRFHETLTDPHPFSSKPWGWLVMGRPIDLYYSAAPDCGASHCSAELFLGGTPVLWWGFIPAVGWALWRYIVRRDWRAGTCLLMFAAGWLVWFSNTERTMFLSYMAPAVPFLVIALSLALGSLLGQPTGQALQETSWPDTTSPRPRRTTLQTLRGRLAAFAEDRRRMWGALGLAVYVGLVIADFGFMWPLFRGASIPTDAWQAHIWFPTWS